MVPEWVWDTEGPAGGHWSPLGREVSLSYHGACPAGGRTAWGCGACTRGWHLGEGPRTDLLGGEQVAIVLALTHLLREGSLIQLLPAAALHGGQCMEGGVVVQFHQSWGAQLRPDLCQRAGARVVGDAGWELRPS